MHHVVANLLHLVHFFDEGHSVRYEVELGPVGLALQYPNVLAKTEICDAINLLLAIWIILVACGPQKRTQSIYEIMSKPLWSSLRPLSSSAR